MMLERDFWVELDRLLMQDDIDAAAELVNEHLESFHLVLRSKFEAAQESKTVH